MALVPSLDGAQAACPEVALWRTGTGYPLRGNRQTSLNIRLHRSRAPQGDGQLLGCPMFTIQAMPNWSLHMPNSSPHICFSSGTITMPEADSFSQ